MMMCVRSVAAVSLLLLLSACGFEQSNLDPSSTVTISGKVLDSDGHPLTTSKVVLIRGIDEVSLVTDFLLTAATLGTACLAESPPVTCQNASRITQTDASGGYSFTFPAAETQATLGAARTMEVITRQAARAGEIGGAVASAAFKVQTTSLTLPDLRIWDPAVGSAASGQTRTWRWPSLPSVDGTSPSYGLEFADRHATPWWLTGPTRSGKSVDVRILEDLNGVTDVAAEARGTATGTKVDFTYVTGTNPLVGTAGAPPSRASPCARAASTGVGAFSDDCWLTSGSLGYSTNSLAGFSAGVLELRQEMPVSLVVVRGCTGECQVSRSSDLTSWSQIGTVSGPYGAVSSTNAASARYVRVTGSIGELRQVSIW